MLQWLNTIVNWWSGKVPEPVITTPVPEVESPELIALKKEQYRAIITKAEKESDANYKKAKKEYDKRNSICPKCGHNVVVEHIQRLQGEINGSMGGSIFGFGGSIHGSMDTNEVNFCTKCSHQWKKGELKDWGGGNIISAHLSWLRIAISHYNKIHNVTFDPTDITEQYNSVEEKLEHVIKNYTDLSNRARKFWGDTSIEVILQFAKEHHSYYNDINYYMEQYFPEKVLHDGLEYKYAKEMLPV